MTTEHRLHTSGPSLSVCWGAGSIRPCYASRRSSNSKLVADRDAGGVTYRNGRLELSGCEERVPVQRPQVHAQPLVERDGGDVVVGGWCPLAHQRFSRPIAIVPGDVPDHGR